MNIGSRNIRGFSKALKHNGVQYFLKQHNLSVFALLESKLDENKLFDIMRWKFKYWKVAHNFNLHEGGRILILWNPLLVSLDVLDVNIQVMHVLITCKVTSKNFLLSFVYGFVVAGRPLWNSLTQFGNSVYAPRLVLGDFNCVLSGSDINGNAHVSSDVLHCCVDLGLVDLNSTDWDELIVGTKQFALCRKLKLLKTPLKALNKKYFVHISTKADMAREELKVAQSSLHDNPQDTTLKEVFFIDSHLYVVDSYRVETKPIFLEHGGLGLRDTRSWNDSLLTKTLWNVPAKKDSLWCRWIHHVYVKSGSIDQTCKLCNQMEETHSHLFFGCPFAKEVWRHIREWLGLRRSMVTIQMSLKWLLKESRGSIWKCKWRKLCFAATLYYIWKCGNKSKPSSSAPAEKSKLPEMPPIPSIIELSFEPDLSFLDPNMYFAPGEYPIPQ
ncbi:hypothetical protein M9H77_03081 [Catharanthus roseus]|uniref:Uncharacterized protein n=1 Tax=Catharanthus roseus TaxID=4058 RepID=A0ACC0CAP5_CATRO|nr:hypothetical protein M9H77_03081 [Catharanthus roseus]